MRRACSLLLAATLLAASPVRAETTPNEAKALKFLEGGYSLLNAGDLEAARAAFLKARDLVPEKANPYRFLGLVEVRLGHCADAVTALDQFLRRVPPNDPRTAEAATLRDKCKDDLVPRVGTLVVGSRPAGAQVRLDDNTAAPVGATPLRVAQVAAGAHVVFLMLPGYSPASKPVQVARGETVHVDVTLTAPAEVTRAAAPREAPHVAEALTTPTPATTPGAATRKKPYWIAGVVGFVAAGAVGIGVGVGVAAQPGERSFPPVSVQ